MIRRLILNSQRFYLNSMVKKSRLNKHYLSNYLSLLRHIEYRHLSKSRVVIFDSAGSEFIEKLIVKDIDHMILPVRKEAIYIFPALFVLFLKNLVWVYLFYRKYRGIYLVYLLSCIEYIKPQAVITFIDNNSLFHAISEIYNKAEFYAVQNGVRTKGSIGKPVCSKGNGTASSRVHFFCFGRHEIDLYKRNGFMIKRFYPIGSLVGSYYRSSSKPPQRKYDLCLVSQWRHSIMFTEEYLAIKNAIITLDNYLYKFVEKTKGLTLCIARCSQDPREEDYFKNRYGKQAQIINFDRKALSTYIAIDSSEVILTFSSSAAYESLGWGKKVLFCNFSANPEDNFPIEGICSITETDYNIFERKLDWLIKVDNEKYSQLTKEDSRYIMSYDCHVPTHEFITKKLTEVLGKDNKEVL